MGFYVGNTVICSVEVREDSVLKSPATSMKIEITRITPLPMTVVVAETAMTPDSTGKYHYDYASSGAPVGTYRAKFIAVDASRTSIGTDTFALE